MWKYFLRPSICGLHQGYSQVSNRRGGWNKWGGWQILAKIINRKGAINGVVGKNPQSYEKGRLE